MKYWKINAVANRNSSDSKEVVIDNLDCEYNAEFPYEFDFYTSNEHALSTAFYRLPVMNWNEVEISCAVEIFKDKSAKMPPECNFILQGDGVIPKNGIYIWFSGEGIKISENSTTFSTKVKERTKSRSALEIGKVNLIKILKTNFNIQIYINNQLRHEEMVFRPSETGFLGINVWGNRKGKCTIRDLVIKEKSDIVYPVVLKKNM